MTLSLFDRPTAFSSMLDDIFADDHDPDGLRWYQREAADRITAAFKEGRSTLVVMATGMGKTVLFGAVAKRWPGPVLVLAHRDELVGQARKHLERATGEIVDLEQAEFKANLRTRIVVGSVASFHKKRLEQMAQDRFTLIIVDECHHAMSSQYDKVLSHFKHAKVLGVTATPDRADEKALGKVFDSVAYVMDIEDGIESGYLVPIRGRTIVMDEIQLDRVEVGTLSGAKDLQTGQLDEEMLKVVEGVCRETLRLEPDRQGIAFFPGVRSAELACQKFNTLRPGSCCFLSAGTPYLERKRIVEDFKAGRYQMLANCAIATEGFDCPPVSLIVQARPTLSRSFYAQTIGRGTRPLAGLVDAFAGREEAADRRRVIAESRKPDCMVLDFVGNSTKHSLIGLEDVLGGNYSELEVQEAKKRRKKGDDDRDPRELLLEARRELERLARSTKAKVKSTVRDFDPFHVFALDDADRYVHRFGEKPASEGQVAALRNLGVPEEDLANLSKKAAGKLLDVVNERRKKGLCNYKQLRQLKKRGITDTNIPFERASAALTYIATCEGWGGRPRKGSADPKQIEAILYHRRESGED